MHESKTAHLASCTRWRATVVMTGIIRKEPSECCWIRGSENENDVVAILTSFMEYHFHM